MDFVRQNRIVSHTQCAQEDESEEGFNKRTENDASKSRTHDKTINEVHQLRST